MQGWIFGARSRSFVLLIGAFAALSLTVWSGVLDQADLAAASAVSEASGNEALDITMQVVTETGDIYYMLVFSVILLIIKRTRRAGLALMILLVLTTLITGYTKCGVDRDRPEGGFESSPHMLEPDRDTFALFCDGSLFASYPSGHAARAAAFGAILGFVLCERYPRGAYLLLLYPALVSLSRVYILQHYPTDVIGGALLGFALAGFIGYRTRLARYQMSGA